MIDVADIVSFVTSMEDFSMNASNEEGVSPLTFIHTERKEIPSSSPAATIETMVCSVKKKRRRKKKKENMDSSLPASADMNNYIRYEPDQWSPMNLEGKKKYGRRFILWLRFHPVCLKKPDNLLARNDLSEIVLEKCLQEERCHLCSGPPPDSEMTTKNGCDPVMNSTKALEKEVVFNVVPESIHPSLAESIFCDSSKFEEAAAYTVLDLEKVTVMPPIKKTEIPLTSSRDPKNPLHPNELKKYDREFLLKLSSHPLCLKQPEGIYFNVLKLKNPTKSLDSIFKNTPAVEPALLVEFSTSSALPTSSVSSSSQKSLDMQQSSEGKWKWNHDSILLLIQAYKEEEPRIKSGQTSKRKAWEKIVGILQAKGINSCYTDCRGRMNILKRQYESMLDLKDGNDQERKKWPYFELLDNIFNESKSTEPLLQLESIMQASIPESFTSSVSNSLPSLHTLNLGNPHL